MSSSIENSSVKFYTTDTIPDATQHVIEPGAVYLYEHDSVMDMYLADGTGNPVLLTTNINRYVTSAINLDDLVTTQTIAVAAATKIEGGDPWGTTQETTEVAFILEVIAGKDRVLQKAYRYSKNDVVHATAYRTGIYSNTGKAWAFSQWEVNSSPSIKSIKKEYYETRLYTTGWYRIFTSNRGVHSGTSTARFSLSHNWGNSRAAEEYSFVISAASNDDIGITQLTGANHASDYDPLIDKLRVVYAKITNDTQVWYIDFHMTQNLEQISDKDNQYLVWGEGSGTFQTPTSVDEGISSSFKAYTVDVGAGMRIDGMPVGALSNTPVYRIDKKEATGRAQQTKTVYDGIKKTRTETLEDNETGTETDIISDFNDIKSPGIYVFASAALVDSRVYAGGGILNRPFDNAFFLEVTVQKGSSSSNIIQRATRYGAAGQSATRVYDGSSSKWLDWRYDLTSSTKMDKVELQYDDTLQALKFVFN